MANRVGPPEISVIEHRDGTTTVTTSHTFPPDRGPRIDDVSTGANYCLGLLVGLITGGFIVWLVM